MVDGIDRSTAPSARRAPANIVVAVSGGSYSGVML
jgi:hypothetical protein